MLRSALLLLTLTGLLAAGLFLPRLRRQRAQRLGLVLLSTLGCLVLVELALAAGVLKPSMFGVVGGLRALPVHMTPHKAESLDSVTVGADLVPTRSNTMRRPADGRRLLFLGDSFTRGDGVRDEETFARVATDIVDASLPEPVQGLNHGISGLQFAHADRLLGEYGMAFEPDVVVWIFVLNDLEARTGMNNDYINHRYLRNGLRGRGVSLAWDLARLAAHQRDVGAQTENGYHWSLNWQGNLEGMTAFRAGLRRQVAAAEERGGRFLFVVFPLLVRLGEYPFGAEHETLLTTARDAGAETLDLLPTFAGRDAESLWVSDSDFHPNAEGHRLAGEAIAAAITAQPIPVSRPRSCPPAVATANAQITDARAAVCADPSDPQALLALGHRTMEATLPGYEFTTPVYAIAAARLAEAAGDPDGVTAARGLVAALRTRLESDPRFRGRN